CGAAGKHASVILGNHIQINTGCGSHDLLVFRVFRYFVLSSRHNHFTVNGFGFTVRAHHLHLESIGAVGVDDCGTRNTHFNAAALLAHVGDKIAAFDAGTSNSVVMPNIAHTEIVMIGRSNGHELLHYSIIVSRNRLDEDLAGGSVLQCPHVF